MLFLPLGHKLVWREFGDVFRNFEICCVGFQSVDKRGYGFQLNIGELFACFEGRFSLVDDWDGKSVLKHGSSVGEDRCGDKHLESLGRELEIVEHDLFFDQLGDASDVEQGCFSLNLAFFHVHFV